MKLLSIHVEFEKAIEIGDSLFDMGDEVEKKRLCRYGQGLKAAELSPRLNAYIRSIGKQTNQ
jgi:hypothetical protein